MNNAQSRPALSFREAAVQRDQAMLDHRCDDRIDRARQVLCLSQLPRVQDLAACINAVHPLAIPACSAAIFAAARRNAAALALAPGARCGTGGVAAATACTTGGSGTSIRGAARVIASDSRDREGCRSWTAGE